MARWLAALGCTAMLTYGGATPARGEELDGAGAAQAVQQAILAQPGGTEKVLSLEDDPNVQSLLNDESVLRAIRSGDLSALARDARVESLMNHPTVRALATDLRR